MGSTQTRRYREFLARLRQAREDAGLTQQQAAAKLRKPQSFISRCETGERRVDVLEFEDFVRLYRKGATTFLPGLPA
jgi:ribosome-binding protein aMBF1 (putative translation factor)